VVPKARADSVATLSRLGLVGVRRMRQLLTSDDLAADGISIVDRFDVLDLDREL